MHLLTKIRIILDKRKTRRNEKKQTYFSLFVIYSEINGIFVTVNNAIYSIKLKIYGKSYYQFV